MNATPKTDSLAVSNVALAYVLSLALTPKLSYSILSAKRKDLYSRFKNSKMLHFSECNQKNMMKHTTECVLLTKHSRDCFKTQSSCLNIRKLYQEKTRP